MSAVPGAALVALPSDGRRQRIEAELGSDAGRAGLTRGGGR
ncbi:MAG TPA: hypothetical protein VGP61_00815 [Gemmatimonadales bacterium]|jgi:hypothetical protein|nr:hypothetical protein [Gemmatimonadales bacterium]